MMVKEVTGKETIKREKERQKKRERKRENYFTRSGVSVAVPKWVSMATSQSDPVG